jgi:CHAD domain-containing protein
MTDLGLRADQSYGRAGRKVIAARSADLFVHIDSVLDTDQPERVHKMRVATRRLRAGIEVFADCFPRKRTRRVLADVKALAAKLGERRDCDVQIELLNHLRRDAGRSERRAIDGLLDELRGEQRAANRRLAKALARAEDAKLEQRLRRLVR